ncbi:TIGR00725 family protein [Solitalea canadensis]|uniref:TIGR00725 family protein n=1 Tax=Solitalea canadensis (strain ATCC 29591 / DSM 3403 / JCM 21819 / LMG 8368 / NBRC 15130 / NCIMB 12057 / USAM 9D) TaxID=929556 RepID=H8KVD8_SOLCM|nr:TIGR00725 family protein [Solitalea canadensis]AFD06318.1 TIGR00725 family protein [Solitalea canadensis DSM 3403]
MNASRVQATVIGDSDAEPEALTAAEAVGAILARLGVTVVTGGRGGIMEAASKGAAEAGGLTVGVLPFEDSSKANSWCKVVIPTGLGHARNYVNILCGDFIIVIGGGAGTLSEMCFAWIQNKPIFALKAFGGYAQEFAGKQLDSLRPDVVISCENLRELEKKIGDWLHLDNILN